VKPVTGERRPDVHPPRIPRTVGSRWSRAPFADACRAVAGCNGDSDGYGDGTCYRSGDVHVNGKHWEADRAAFGESPGRYDKRDWHRVRVRFRLNSIRDVVFRTGRHPDMKIDQFLMAPYFGPGVPHPQRIWIDDLRIHTDDPPSIRLGTD